MSPSPRTLPFSLRRMPPGVALAAALLLAVHAVLVVASGRATGATVDESNYFNCGHIILEHGWVHQATVFQGPVPLYANQLLVGDFPSGGYDGRHTPHELLERGRLGTLPFALLSAVLVFLWARRLFGEAGGLLALLLHALNPLLIGFGSLALVDAQHAALTLLTLFLLWCWVETRAPLLLLGVGVALGLSLATKYLALFLLPPVGASVLMLSASRAHGVWPRMRAAVGSTAVVALATWTTMHAAYRFHEGLATFELGPSASQLMKSVMATPVLGRLAMVLPAPFLRGLDFQLFQGQREWRCYLNGVTAPSHDDFYVWSMLCKTPELVLALAALVAVLVLPRLLRRDCDPRWRSAAVLTLSYATLAFGYLSLFTEMQLGIRYIVPVYPVLFLWLGSLGWGSAPTRPAFLALCALTVGLHAFDLRRNWPDLISYYNVSSGGQAHAYERFRDTNSDFGQYEFTGPALLRRRFPDVQILGSESGARFGRLALGCGDLRDEILRWLGVHPQLGHLGASWWVFDVRPEGFERALAASGDPDLRRDLCIAYLGAGRREAARRNMMELDPERAAPLRALTAALDAARCEPTRERLERLILAWSDVGRLDLAEAVSLDHPAELAGSREAAVARLRAREDRLELEAAAAVFDEFPFAPDDMIRVRLVTYLRTLGRHAEGRAAFEALRASLAPRWVASPPIARLSDEIEQHGRYLELLR